MAKFIWWSIILIHTFWAVWGIVADIVLIQSEDGSVTRYLRENAWAFIIPSVLGLVAWGILLWHLFIQSR